MATKNNKAPLKKTNVGKSALKTLLGKFETSEIRTAFADAIGKVGKAAKKVFYPLPPHKDKLIRSFLELIYDGKSIMT